MANSFNATAVFGILITFALTIRFIFECIILNTIHYESIVSVIVIMTGGPGLNLFTYLIWYKYKENEYKLWRNQPSKIDSHSLHPYHHIIYVHNLILSSVFCGWCTELIIRCKLYLSAVNSNIVYILFMFIISIIYQSVLEYYWHRIMHFPWFYKTFHKLHHYYKSPQPFDDLIVHPLENFGYYLIMYSPPFVIPNLPIYSFILYIIYIGITGVLDHCGIHFYLPYIYDTKDHDNHHKLFNCNYAFPHPFMDYIHGTQSKNL